MDLNRKFIEFYNNAGHGRLYLTAFPALFALIIAENIFNFDLWCGILITVSCIIFQLCTQILDDYIDFILSKTTKRLELEQTGVRGLYTKAVYFLNDKKAPRKYFYMALFLFVFAVLLFICACIMSKNFTILLFLFPLPLFLLINYHPKFKKVINFVGTEFLCAFSCTFLTMLCVFFASAKCVIFPLIYSGLIFFFFTYNLLYTSSLLNLKPDIMTEKTTLPVIIKNENAILIFSGFLTLFPFILLPIGVYYDILPKISLTAELLIFHSVWFICLIYLFIKAPQKTIKWHFLMGTGKNEVENEQNNIGWYTIRYNLLENIYMVFSLILILSFTNFKNILMF